MSKFIVKDARTLSECLYIYYIQHRCLVCVREDRVGICVCVCAESDVSALGGHAEMGLKKGYGHVEK